MTCIVSPQHFPTKKALKQRIEEINNSEWITPAVWIEDPSIVNPRAFFATNMKEGEEVVVTNHPKRSWFAQVGRKGGKLYVK